MHQDDGLGLILVAGLNGVQKVEVLLGGDPVPFIRDLIRIIAKRPLVPQVADALHQNIVAGGLIKGQVEFPIQRRTALQISGLQKIPHFLRQPPQIF